MDTKELLKYSVAKNASKFKEEFGKIMHSLVVDKINQARPEIAKTMFNEASGDKEAYQKFFNAKLEKYGVSSPSELSDEEKKKFFDEIDAEWDGDNEKD